MILKTFIKIRKNKPLWGVINGDTIPLFEPGNGLTLQEAFDNLQIFSDLYKSKHTILTSDFKKQLSVLKVDGASDIYDCAIYDIDTPQDAIAKLEDINITPWQKILANAAFAYHAIQSRGFLLDYHRIFPGWDLDTYSGRSRTSEISIQGFTSEYNIDNPALASQCFLHCDWIAADMRAASILSSDKVLNDAFANSDPYEYVADVVNGGISEDALTRDEAKLALLGSINSMNHDAHILDYFPGVRAWVLANKAILTSGQNITSILGREFHVGGERTELSAFNASMQGTIAHAMHIVFRKLWEIFGSYLFIEMHDSITITVPMSKVEECIEIIKPIMEHPFRGLIDNNPVFPIRMYLGKRWKKWYKVC